jgi:hypothetical protein
MNLIESRLELRCDSLQGKKISARFFDQLIGILRGQCYQHLNKLCDMIFIWLKTIVCTAHFLNYHYYNFLFVLSQYLTFTYVCM